MIIISANALWGNVQAMKCYVELLKSLLMTDLEWTDIELIKKKKKNGTDWHILFNLSRNID